jgi:MFS family permease
MCFGALCYSFWIFSFLLPSYYSQQKDRGSLPWYLKKGFIEAVCNITSGITGFGAGILWVCQGNFIS